MFTGIVEETGRVVAASQTDQGFRLHIAARRTLESTKLGDSISVNGTCLTVTEIDASSFAFGVAPESLSRTNLGTLHPDDLVNLERSVTPTTRLGGHFVQGHIDGTGVVTTVSPDAESVRVTIKVPAEMMQWIVPKGYVAIDGISLTVVDVGPAWFSIMLVPYTIEHVAPGLRSVGYRPNIEVDILGKYVANVIAHTQQKETTFLQQYGSSSEA